MNFDIVIRPIVTEKSLKLVEERNQYTFEVDKRATKNNVSETISDKFKVTVEKVRIVRIPPKRITWGKKRIQGRKKAIKKAIVTLKNSDSIDLFKVS